MPHLNHLNEQLFEASKRGDSDAVKALTPQTDPAFNESAALRVAAEHGHADCVRLLIPVSDPTEDNSLALLWPLIMTTLNALDCLFPPATPKSATPELCFGPRAMPMPSASDY